MLSWYKVRIEKLDVGNRSKSSNPTSKNNRNGSNPKFTNVVNEPGLAAKLRLEERKNRENIETLFELLQKMQQNVDKLCKSREEK